jgi:hypothetical protein
VQGEDRWVKISPREERWNEGNLEGAHAPSPWPSPRGGFAQIFKIEYKIDGFILLKIDKMSPKQTFWAKPPEGEGE